MNVTVYCGAAAGDDPAYEKTAIELGIWIAKNGHHLVWGGGSTGLMGAVCNAMLDAGGTGTGVIPRFLLEIEQPPERPVTLEVVETMATRRARMIELGDVFVALPGGTGTLEELSEVTSLIKLKLKDTICILMNVNGYYDPLVATYDAMVEHGFMVSDVREKLVSVATVDEFEEILI